MKQTPNINKQSGFSLTELIVVVALIAVLGTMAVPSYQRAKNRAVQNEARTALLGLYTAESNFRQEFKSYYGDFRSIGFVQRGPYNYVVGFANRGVPGSAFGLTNLNTQGGAPAETCFHNHMDGCGVNPATGQPNIAEPTNLASDIWPKGQAPIPPATTPSCGFTVTQDAPTATAFAAAAQSHLTGSNTLDRWAINETKTLCNIAPASAN